MFGSPTSFNGVPLASLWEPGFGSPSTFDGSEFGYQGSGFGSPTIGYLSGDGETPVEPPTFAFTTTVANGEYGDDGGALVTLVAPGGFPSRGPYRVRLVDADGNLWPPATHPACYSAQAGGGDACMTNRSQELLRFTLPKLPQGAYGVRLSWNDGLDTAELDEVILVVPSDLCLESLWLRRAFG